MLERQESGKTSQAVTPEAVMAAAEAIGATYGHDGAMYCADAERALEAAVPLLKHGLDPDEVMRAYHAEFCECDGLEDGTEVCAGECREFVEQFSATSTKGETQS